MAGYENLAGFRPGPGPDMISGATLETTEHLHGSELTLTFATHGTTELFVNITFDFLFTANIWPNHFCNKISAQHDHNGDRNIHNGGRITLYCDCAVYCLSHTMQLKHVALLL